MIFLSETVKAKIVFFSTFRQKGDVCGDYSADVFDIPNLSTETFELIEDEINSPHGHLIKFCVSFTSACIQ